MKVTALETHAEAAAAAAKEAEKAAKKEIQDFRELSTVLEQVQTKIAAALSPEREIGEEAGKLEAAVQRALDKLYEEKAAGRLKPGVFDREIASAREALALIPGMADQVYADLDKKRSAEISREMDALNRRDAEEFLKQVAREHEQEKEWDKALQDVDDWARKEKDRLDHVEGERAKSLIHAAAELQKLRNSQGWEGVFGDQFAQMLRRNEELLKEWESSADRSAMLVRVSLESLKESGQDAFEQLEKGMASNITHAIIYKQSIGEAMKAATEAVIEQVAERAAVQAIDAAAWGFFDLATGDFPGAAAAFESAALFGSVAAAASIAGRAIGPSQGGASGAGAGASASSSSASASDYSAAGGQQGPHVTVQVMGHLVGWTNLPELTAAINDAVLNKDVTLTATNTKTGVQVTR